MGRRVALTVATVFALLVAAWPRTDASVDAASTTTVTVTSTATPTLTVTPTTTPGVGGGGATVAAPTATPIGGGPVTKRVNVFGRRFSPGTIKVPVGSTIVWRNGDRVKHTVTGTIFRDSFGGVFDIAPATAGSPSVLPHAAFTLDSGPLAPRAEPAYPGGPRPPESQSSYFQFTFQEEGTYTYHCTIHGSMNGTIVVGSGERQSTTGGGSGGGTPPPTPTPVTNSSRLITVFGNRFRPQTVKVVVGTTIHWRDGDRIDHDVIGETFRDANGGFFDFSPNPDPSGQTPPVSFAPLNGHLQGRPPPTPGESQRPESPTLTYTFDQPGTYTYRGELGQMRGTIAVVTPTPTP